MTGLDGNIVDVPNPSGRGPGYRQLIHAHQLFDKSSVYLLQAASPVPSRLFVAPIQVASHDGSVSPDPLEFDGACATLPELQEERDKTSQIANFTSMDVDEAKSVGEPEPFIEFATAGPHHPVEVDARSESIRNGMQTQKSNLHL